MSETAASLCRCGHTRRQHHRRNSYGRKPCSVSYSTPQSFGVCPCWNFVLPLPKTCGWPGCTKPLKARALADEQYGAIHPTHRRETS